MAKIKIDKERCKGCRLCIVSCPAGLIVPAAGLNKWGVNPAEFRDAKMKCAGCAFCAIICPDCAIEVLSVRS